MYRDFKNALRNFIEDRVEEIGNKFVIKNKKYKDLVHNCINVHNQIKVNLPDQFRCLIDEYETINSSMQCISEEILYKQGFVDGIRLNRTIKSIKSGRNLFGWVFLRVFKKFQKQP